MMMDSITLSNKETISYIKEGDGPNTIVLIHGNMSSSLSWDLFLDYVSEDFTVYAPDLRGFGDSSYEKSIASIKDFSDDLKLFTDALNIKGFTVVGWSLGGNVAMQYTIDYPEDVKKLILMASGSIKGFPIKKRVFFGLVKTSKYIDNLEDMEKAVAPLEKLKDNNNVHFIRRLLNNSLYSKNKPNEQSYDAYIQAMIKQRNLPETNLALSYFNISDQHNGVVEGNNDVHKITCPTLIIHGKSDRVVPYEVAEDNHEALKANSVLKHLDASHAPLLDERKKVIELIESFAK